MIHDVKNCVPNMSSCRRLVDEVDLSMHETTLMSEKVWRYTLNPEKMPEE